MSLTARVKNRLGIKPRIKLVKKSYSQCGEDLIIDFVFEQLRIQKPSYIDIGAHHPYYISNTAYFYNKGSKGVCIEPDPALFNKIKKVRKKDICLNVGISDVSGMELDFYIMNVPTLNTFSKEEAERYATYPGKKIEKVIKMPLITVTEVIENNMNGKCPDFISLDIEGMDMAVLTSFNFKRFRPTIFCIETLSYTESKGEEKQDDIITYMKEQGYKMYADTYINSIFVYKETWENRFSKKK